MKLFKAIGLLALAMGFISQPGLYAYNKGGTKPCPPQPKPMQYGRQLLAATWQDPNYDYTYDILTYQDSQSVASNSNSNMLIWSDEQGYTTNQVFLSLEDNSYLTAIIPTMDAMGAYDSNEIRVGTSAGSIYNVNGTTGESVIFAQISEPTSAAAQAVNLSEIVDMHLDIENGVIVSTTRDTFYWFDATTGGAPMATYPLPKQRWPGYYVQGFAYWNGNYLLGLSKENANELAEGPGLVVSVTAEGEYLRTYIGVVGAANPTNGIADILVYVDSATGVQEALVANRSPEAYYSWIRLGLSQLKPTTEGVLDATGNPLRMDYTSAFSTIVGLDSPDQIALAGTATSDNVLQTGNGLVVQFFQMEN